MRGVLLFLVLVLVCLLVVAVGTVWAQSGPGNVSAYAVGNSFSSAGENSMKVGGDVRLLEAQRASFGFSYLNLASGGTSEHRTLFTIDGVEKAGADSWTTTSTKMLLGTVRVNLIRRAVVQPFGGFSVGKVTITETNYGSNLKLAPDFVNNPNAPIIISNFERFAVPGQTIKTKPFVFGPTVGGTISIPKTPIVISPGFTYLIGGNGYRVQLGSIAVGVSLFKEDE